MHARQLKREGEHRLCIPECIRYCVLSALRFGVLLPILRMTARRVCSISGIKSPRPRRPRPRRESPMARGPLLLFVTMLPLVSSLWLPVCSVHKGDSSSRRDFLVKAATAAAMAVFQLPSPAMASGRKAAVLVSDEEEAADESDGESISDKAAAKAKRRARRKAERARRKELKAQRRAKRASRKESKAKKPKRGQKARAADEEESTSADAESSSSDSEEGS